MNNNCSKHKKEVAGISDMKVLAEIIGDLHYETLYDFMIELQIKLLKDSINDERGGRIKLSYCLADCAASIGQAAFEMKEAWEISKPFMINN